MIPPQWCSSLHSWGISHSFRSLREVATLRGDSSRLRPSIHLYNGIPLPLTFSVSFLHWVQNGRQASLFHVTLKIIQWGRLSWEWETSKWQYYEFSDWVGIWTHVSWCILILIPSPCWLTMPLPHNSHHSAVPTIFNCLKRFILQYPGIKQLKNRAEEGGGMRDGGGFPESTSPKCGLMTTHISRHIFVSLQQVLP